MRWRSEPLRLVAPSKPAAMRFQPTDEAWHLGLEHIESHTGRILGRRISPAGEAGTSTFVFDDGNVLYSKLRPYLNKVVRPRESGIATTELIPLRPRMDVIDPDFLTYYLRSPDFVAFASACVAGVKMPRLIMDKFWNYSVPVPPISEQRRIVEILDRADALRKMRAEADAKAERILPALFRQIFGELSSNSKGWKQVKLSRLGKIVTGNTPSREHPEFFDGMVPWARPADLERELPLFHTEQCLSPAGANVARLVPSKSVLVCCIGATLGKVGFTGVEMAINQQINAIVPGESVTPEFLYALCLLSADRFRAAATQATLPILNKSRFGEQEVILPPKLLQESFSQSAAILIAQHAERAAARDRLDTLFAVLLRRAFSGDLTAKWREAHMKELLAEMEHQAKALNARNPDEGGSTSAPQPRGKGPRVSSSRVSRSPAGPAARILEAAGKLGDRFTIPDLLEVTALSRPTIDKAVKTLVGEGRLEEVHRGRPSLYRMANS